MSKKEDLFYEVYHYAARVTKRALILQQGKISQKDFNDWAVSSLNNINDIKEWMSRVSKVIDKD